MSEMSAEQRRRLLVGPDDTARWRPIEVAPKDGSFILAICIGQPPQYMLVVSWRTYHPNAKGKPEWRDTSGVKHERVTHWMPLPEGP